MTAISNEDIEMDREVKKSLAAKAISNSPCNNALQFQNLRAIGQVPQDGDQLQLDIMSGGHTNFFLKKNLNIQLYAKFFALSCFMESGPRN